MTAILERPPAQATVPDIALAIQNTGQLLPLHPFDEDPIKLSQTLQQYPAEQTVAVKSLVTQAVTQRHVRALEQLAELRTCNVPDISVAIPRAALIPNLIGQETMSALGITRRVLGLEVQVTGSDPYSVTVVERK